MRTQCLSVFLLISVLAPSAESPAQKQTWTGWFSDAQCAKGRVERGDIGPNGTECVKKCLRSGVTAVFISEQAKAMFEVRDHPTVIEDVGYHVEVTGMVDENAKTMSVQSVRRLAEVPATCGLPKKRQAKK